MTLPLSLHSDRLFPADSELRSIARRLYGAVANLPIISPHGHTDPIWWATDANFGNAAELLLHPDHYVFRMLYSQGVSLESLGIGNPDADPRESWRLFAERFHLFRGTPSRGIGATPGGTGGGGGSGAFTVGGGRRCKPSMQTPASDAS